MEAGNVCDEEPKDIPAELKDVCSDKGEKIEALSDMVLFGD